jgi:predicted dehydrogenase
VSVDLAAREARVYRLSEQVGEDGRPDIDVVETRGEQEEPLRRQLAAFVRAVATGSRPVVSGEDGRRALALARTVLDRMADYN